MLSSILHPTDKPLMLKQDIRILIVEDDQTFGRSIEEAFKRAGYPCRLTSSVEEAETAFKINGYPVVILDCMLPRINGVQLAESFRENAGDNFKILLISGIFKDRSFINDALRKTKALGFFSKPFDSMILVDAVESAFEDLVEQERDPLFLLLTKESHSLKERLEALEKTESIHGFDLPFVYSLLIGTTVSGDLNIITADGEASSVTFSEGKITQVNIQDKTSYFGVLLVEHGFTSNEEVTTGLSGTSEKPIGERLVEANALSPHAISLVRREQSAIRLSKTIQDTSVQISFHEHPVNDSQEAIDSSALTTLLNDWVISKLSINWLRAFYTPWLEYSVRFGAEKSRYEIIKGQSLLNLVPGLLKTVDNSKTLQEILNLSSSHEHKALRALHFLFLERILVFDTRPINSIDYDGKEKRLTHMINEGKGQNHFEILGISQKAKDREINRAYLDLAKVLHPDKLEQSVPQHIKDLQTKVFARIAEAYDVLRETNRRERYLNELTRGDAQGLLRDESQFEEAVRLLHRGTYQKALEILLQISQTRKNRTDFLLYLLWAKIKNGPGETGKERQIDEVGYQLNHIPPDERHTAVYIFVKGLYLKMTGKFDKAYTYFNHALTMDPSLTPAKRELVGLEGELRRSSNSGDLTSIVGMFFNNKGKAGRGKG